MIRCEQYIEAEVGRTASCRTSSFSAVNGRFGQQQGRDKLGAGDEQMLARIRHAGVQQGGCCQADHATGLVDVAGLYQRLTVKTPSSSSALRKARQPSSV